MYPLRNDLHDLDLKIDHLDFKIDYLKLEIDRTVHLLFAVSDCFTVIVFFFVFFFLQISWYNYLTYCDVICSFWQNFHCITSVH